MSGGSFGTAPSDAAAFDAAAFDAVVLAGGLARRFEGASKPDVEVDGRRMLDHVLTAVDPAGRVVLVAPDTLPAERPGGGPLLRTMEDPPGGGPVAGLAAGLAALAGSTTPGAPAAPAAPDAGAEPADMLVVLSCDVPRVGPAVPRLLATLASAPADVDAACLTTRTPGTGDSAGRERTQYLVAAYRRAALTSALARLAAEENRADALHGAAMRGLVGRLRVTPVPALGDEGADVDSWADLQRLTGEPPVR